MTVVTESARLGEPLVMAEIHAFSEPQLVPVEPVDLAIERPRRQQLLAYVVGGVAAATLVVASLAVAHERESSRPAYTNEEVFEGPEARPRAPTPRNPTATTRQTPVPVRPHRPNITPVTPTTT